MSRKIRGKNAQENAPSFDGLLDVEELMNEVVMSAMLAYIKPLLPDGSKFTLVVRVGAEDGEAEQYVLLGTDSDLPAAHRTIGEVMASMMLHPEADEEEAQQALH